MDTVTGKEFAIRYEGPLPGTIEQAWDAITEGTSGWLWPTEYEHREGGEAPYGGTVLVWDPPHRVVGRTDGENGWFNQLENVLDHTPEGGVYLRYVHSGVFTDDWDSQYDGASKHTVFYLHTLGQYIEYFPGRRAAYLGIHDGPATSLTPQGFGVLTAALGISDRTSVGDRITVSIPGLDRIDAEIDYIDDHFVGLRTTDAMYRFFGRNAWGAPVGMGHHLFAPDADAERAERSWRDWIEAVYA